MAQPRTRKLVVLLSGVATTLGLLIGAGSASAAPIEPSDPVRVAGWCHYNQPWGGSIDLARKNTANPWNFAIQCKDADYDVWRNQRYTNGVWSGWYAV